MSGCAHRAEPVRMVQAVGPPKTRTTARAPTPDEPRPARRKPANRANDGAPALAPIGVGGQHTAAAGPRRITLDRRLARLAEVGASVRSAAGGPRRPRAPKALVAEWDGLLAHLDRYLDQPPRKTPPVELVRAKVTLETEIEAAGRSFRLPGSLVDRVRSRLAYLDHRISQARSRLVQVPVDTSFRSLVWPIEPVVVNSSFGWRRDPLQRRKRRFHFGIDLDAYRGQVVVAAGPGVVTWAGRNGGHGNQIELTHPAGWVTRYSHLSYLLVRRGDRVTAKDPVGLAGSTGRSTGPHLHFEVWRNGDVVDPIDALGDPALVGTYDGRGIGGP